jgi:CBS domain-containing protein
MEQGQLTGMLTFREIIRHMHDSPGSLENTTIRKIMDDAPVSVSPNTEAEEVRRLMLEHHARYVPVMDGPVLMGVISFYDMARAMLEASKFENKMLKAYIRDWPGEPEDEKD